MASSLPPIVDTRFLSQPPSFDGKAENFGGWKFLVVNYLSLHEAANCWANADLKCTSCGRTGHLAATCWAKAGKGQGKGKKCKDVNGKDVNAVAGEEASVSGASSTGPSASKAGGKIEAVTQEEWDEYEEQPWTCELDERIFAINDAGE